MHLLDIEPIYIVLYVVAVFTAVVMAVDRAAARRLPEQPHQHARRGPAAAPTSRLQRLQAAVEDLTDFERRCLCRWRDERWGAESPLSSRPAAPLPAPAPDERITTAAPAPLRPS